MRCLMFFRSVWEFSSISGAWSLHLSSNTYLAHLVSWKNLRNCLALFYVLGWGWVPSVTSRGARSKDSTPELPQGSHERSYQTTTKAACSEESLPLLVEPEASVPKYQVHMRYLICSGYYLFCVVITKEVWTYYL